MSRHTEVVTAIGRYWRARGFAPSLRDVGDMMRGGPSTSQVSYWVRRLRSDGLVDYEDGIPRSLRLTALGWQAACMAPPCCGGH